MAYKIYFDVNVILDYTLQRSNFNEIEKIFNNIENGLQRGYITSATIHTVSYFLSKEYEQKNVKKILLGILSTITVIDAPQEILNNALQANFNDIEDALQVYTALHYKMDFFLTSDKKLILENSKVLPIISVTEFVVAYC
jgi:predicted nucleic acid-binding protein